MVIGVKESTLLNKLFTVLNIVVIGFIVICGAIKADIANWNVEVNVNYFNLF